MSIVHKLLMSCGLMKQKNIDFKLNPEHAIHVQEQKY